MSYTNYYFKLIPVRPYSLTGLKPEALALQPKHRIP